MDIISYLKDALHYKDQFIYECKEQAKLYRQRIDHLQRECIANDVTIRELCNKIDKYREVLKPLSKIFLEEKLYLPTLCFPLNQSSLITLNNLQIANLEKVSLEIKQKQLMCSSKRCKRLGCSAEPINLSFIEECVGLVTVVPKASK